MCSAQRPNGKVMPFALPGPVINLTGSRSSADHPHKQYHLIFTAADPACTNPRRI